MRRVRARSGIASSALFAGLLGLGLLANARPTSASPVQVWFTAEVVSTVEILDPSTGIGPAPIGVGSTISGAFEYDPLSLAIAPGAYPMSSMQLQFLPAGLELDAAFRSSTIGDPTAWRQLRYIGDQLTSRSSPWRSDDVAVVLDLANHAQPAFTGLPAELSLDEFGPYPESYLLIDGLACPLPGACPDIADDGWEAWAKLTSLTTIPVPEPGGELAWAGAMLAAVSLRARRRDRR